MSDLSDVVDASVMAQAHRWYSFYERNGLSPETQMGIVDKDFYLKSSLGESKGADAFLERIRKLPADWKNSHHIISATTHVLDPQHIQLSMRIVYQNYGMQPDNALSSSSLQYLAKLKKVPYGLPQFQSVNIETLGAEKTSNYSTYRDRYAENRAKSLIYYAVHCSAQNKAGLSDIADPAIAKTIAVSLNTLGKNGLRLENFHLQHFSEDEWMVSADIVGSAETKGSTSLRWMLRNTVSDAFPKLQKAL